MSVFRLAGLLRLRRLQEDGVRAELARTRATEAARRRDAQRVRRVLGDSAVEPASVDAVQSIAAARASSSSMLGELDALLRQDREAVLVAAAAAASAKTRTTQLEKLEEKHAVHARRSELRSQQSGLDEHAGRAAARNGGTS